MKEHEDICGGSREYALGGVMHLLWWNTSIKVTHMNDAIMTTIM